MDIKFIVITVDIYVSNRDFVLNMSVSLNLK